MKPKTVCIIGAGPSGLVTAKQLLHTHAVSGSGFSVTVFDRQPRIGGLWPLESTDGAGLVHPLMVANQSRHTVQFSDLAWEDNAPQLPKAWQVGRYLQRYLDRYCAFEQDTFRLRLGWNVTSARQDPGAEKKWVVAAESDTGLRAKYEFDHLVIASGFFAKPAIPPSLRALTGPRIIHSSRYRDLASLLPTANAQGTKILVVGGQMSGVEIAGTIASHLSSAANTPGTSELPDVEKYKIHHVIQRPTWIFPLSTTPVPARSAAPFLPLDLPSYNLANRPKPLVNHQGHISVESAKTSHNIFRSVLGTDQSEYSPLLAPRESDMQEPAYLAVSDWYTEFVRSGLITVSKGKLDAVSGTTATITPLLSEEQEPYEVTDIAAIVLATGFEASPSLDCLPEEIQSKLGIDRANLNNTVLLDFHGTHHRDIPNLGFVGFYRSPYWGVMEMQARFLCELWTQQGQGQGQLSASMQRALDQDNTVERFAALRGDPRVSQFPMGDYAYLMQEFASALDMEILPPGGLTPSLPHNGKSMDILTPARYVSKQATAVQQAEVERSLKQTYETALAGLTKGKFVARAVFRSLLGEWQLERDLVSKLASHPSGHWSGTAKFLLRQGTKDGRQCVKDDADNGSTNDGKGLEEDDLGLEYLYIEEGEFKMANGLTIPATRRYIWRYDDKADKLSVWFVRTGDKFSRKDPRRDEEQMKADYLFHEVEFVVPEDYWERGADDSQKGWEAKAGHLCVEDFYDVKYEFKFQAVNLREWSLAYTVKGPQKDYTIDGVYRRKAT